MTIQQRLEALRDLMRQNNIDAYIVPGTDPHASEYMAPHWQEMSWITGFAGEAGTAVITQNRALLWTDSRYYLQAEKELQGTTVELMRASDVDCPCIEQWLTDDVKLSGMSHYVVGVNPEMYSVNSYNDLKSYLANEDIDLCSCDLIKNIWVEGRPEIPLSRIYEYEEKYAGESVESKLARVREQLSQRRCDTLIMAELDEIGWLLNIRGKDVDYTPCVIAYVVVEMDKCTLFVDSRKLNDTKVQQYLQENDITVKDYDAIFSYLRALSSEGVMYDGARVNEALYESLNPAVKRKVNVSPSPVQVMMSVKNVVEIAGERIAMVRDGVALTRFFKWLDEIVTPRLKVKGTRKETEITLANKLHTFRQEQTNCTDDSFATIAGWKGNGAIVHYHAEIGSCAKIDGNGVLLLDSGGQYLDGTTDITRTVWVGDEKAIPDYIKRDYTLVLKGHIALAKARFPKGTRGNQLDVLAHQYMWAEGITYGHGTGHGVGHFMGCHEGPANIRTDNNPNPIREGNIFSDEPGIYRTGEYGIRIENLILTKPAEQLSARSTGEQYYEFETLTLCFYDTNLIDKKMLTHDEIEWINTYHKYVYTSVAPRLNQDEKEYLAHKCKKI